MQISSKKIQSAGFESVIFVISYSYEFHSRHIGYNRLFQVQS